MNEFAMKPINNGLRERTGIRGSAIPALLNSHAIGHGLMTFYLYSVK